MVRMLGVMIFAVGMALAFAEPMDASSQFAPPQEAAVTVETAAR